MGYIKNALIVFTRIPEAGHTKTRMMPYFTEKECENLHRCFLEDINSEIKKIDIDLFICYTSNSRDVSEVINIFGESAKYFPQIGEDIGIRMKNSIDFVFNIGYEKVVLIGTDVPEISSITIKNAFFELEKKDLVFGKTFDGGYYLVGMKKMIKDVFEVKSYGHNHVFEDTLKKLENKYEIGYVNTLNDMDDKEDIKSLYRRYCPEEFYSKNNFIKGEFLYSDFKHSNTCDVSTNCEETVERNTYPKNTIDMLSDKFLSISIVIPVYNESSTIDNLLRQLEEIDSNTELIFVDGGSLDSTFEKINHWIEKNNFNANVFKSEKGRANQMNFGAEKSRGDIIFFLHSDSVLPKKFLSEIRETIKKYSWGCFGIDFKSRHFFMYTNKWISNHRAKFRGIVFGDQGIFIKRSLFEKVGGYKKIPIMEDYQLSLDIKKLKIPVGMTKNRILTSDRRYPKGTLSKVKVMWSMFWLRRLYRLGVDVEEISIRYKDIR